MGFIFIRRIFVSIKNNPFYIKILQKPYQIIVMISFCLKTSRCLINSNLQQTDEALKGV